MDITKLPNKILAEKTVAVPIEEIKNSSYKELISIMRKEMKEHEGVGLAANQINKDLSIFVIDENVARQAGVTDVFINPEITEYSKESDELEEGCLSIPGFNANIIRSKKIKIKALDENGKKIKLKARGFLARIIQHETDHLNGLTIKDRVNKK